MSRILTIVGSQELALGQIHKAWDIIKKEIQEYQPEKIYSGGAKGVDTYAIECANIMGFPWEEFRPTAEDLLLGGFGKYKPRNMKLAAICDRLVCIRSHQSTTYGSGWTADYAEKLGKQVERYKI